MVDGEPTGDRRGITIIERIGQGIIDATQIGELPINVLEVDVELLVLGNPERAG